MAARTKRGMPVVRKGKAFIKKRGGSIVLKCKRATPDLKQ
jgi:hypothetical protein